MRKYVRICASKNLKKLKNKNAIRKHERDIHFKYVFLLSVMVILLHHYVKMYGLVASAHEQNLKQGINIKGIYKENELLFI